MTLADVFPQPRRLQVGGRDFDVLPLVMRQIPGFLTKIAAPWTLIMAEEYLAALMQFPEEIRDAISIATGADADWLDNLRPDDFLDLTKTVLEVNLDFFARRVLPKVGDLGRSLQQIRTTISPSAPDLSKQGTDTTI